jgi:hypothetical protein
MAEPAEETLQCVRRGRRGPTRNVLHQGLRLRALLFEEHEGRKTARTHHKSSQILQGSRTTWESNLQEVPEVFVPFHPDWSPRPHCSVPPEYQWRHL